jgi:N-methylhydantoinase A/oxoprolinase/acetone carboxylase beta subunit
LLNAREAEVMRRIGEAPAQLHRVAASSGAQRTLKGLARRGLVQIAAFTPSDAAHVLGLQTTWSKDGAVKTARLLAWHRDMAQPSDERVQEFCREVWSEVVAASARVILETALGERLEGDRLIEAVCRGIRTAGLARVAVTPSLPIVAVGAPVRIYYPEAGARLGAEVVFPDHFDAANAVGAAVGVVARAVEVEVTGDGGGSFRVHGPQGPRSFGDAASALRHAETEAVEGARQAVLAMGAEAVETRVSVDKRLLPDALDDNGLFEALVTAEAIGRPALGRKP